MKDLAKAKSIAVSPSAGAVAVMALQAIELALRKPNSPKMAIYAVGDILSKAKRKIGWVCMAD